ncbi:hypothetical protein EZV73_12555 [Acidaminobacter sp. JC074]|uniref:sensor histidine kinase n=1 Tax=Acidaminobacter sp. JC074 TaxID=2530199 RepID=UPI001F11586A|nr:ATP-binding protein [Acidaminobacter sp. JC074]MCH4888414.1 hypothetical protein [Acidaminobacter sp. JC074]
MKRHTKRILLSFFIALFIFSLFALVAFFESRNNLEEEKNKIKSREEILVSRINTALNYSIGGAEGVVSFIKTYPNLNQEDFSNYVSKVLDPNNNIVSHLVAIKDTTIAFSHPLEGNESGIGVDLATIEGQKEQILKVKNENISMLVGPIELVEGGVHLINRMPVFLSSEDKNVYWGQLSVIIRYQALLDSAGIEGLADQHFIEIRQVNNIDDSESIIYSNHRDFTPNVIATTVQVPNGHWVISIEPKEGLNKKSVFFYTILIVGAIFSLALGAIINYIMKVNHNLNKIVDIRTEHIQNINLQLESSLEKLKSTQKQLIEKEKLASLGELVAGVAHEINTPIGVSITTNSYLENVIDSTTKKLDTSQLRKSDLVKNLKLMKDSSVIISDNLKRSSTLVNNFKLLAADKNIEKTKKIKLKSFIDYISHSILQSYNLKNIEITCEMDPELEITTIPGGLAQVMTNLINNSITHGFYDKTGQIEIISSFDENNIYLDYLDNGCGISSENADKVFQPFFTTKRAIGSTGLGLHIVYNTIHQQLGGHIELVLDEKKGVHFKITLPNH